MNIPDHPDTSENSATLHMIVGMICAGKSTLAKRLARNPQTIVVSEDQWLSDLYAKEMNTVADYVHFSAKLRAAIEPLLVQLLKNGLSVVLDFPANTLANRTWMRGIFEKAGCSHTLHYLNVPKDVCKMRLHTRNDSQEHEFATSDAQFDLIASHFVAPTEGEGFSIVLHSGSGGRSV